MEKEEVKSTSCQDAEDVAKQKPAEGE